MRPAEATVAIPTDRDTACGVREEHRRHHQWALAFMADDFRLPPPPIVVGGGGRGGGVDAGAAAVSS